MKGGGPNIWDAADQFRYAYQPLNGDGQITARVVSMQNTHDISKAGLMIRTSVNENSAHAFVHLRPSGAIAFVARATGGGTTVVVAESTQPAPTWLRLARTGNTIVASVSANGSAWTVVGSTNATLGASVLVGLAVTSHDANVLNTSIFDTVSVTTGSTTPPGTPASPTPTSGATGVSTTASLTWSATGATSYDVSFGTVNPPPQVTTSQAAASYQPPTLVAGATYFWRVVARNAGGTTTGPVWSFVTAAAPGTPTAPTPTSGATGVSTNATLTWSAPGATSYDVSFGTANPPPQVTTNQAAASYQPAATVAGTTYLWRVVARNAAGTTTGPVWSYTTAAAPAMPSAPTPVSGATGVATNATLTWSGAGATSYDVSFGTANPPPQVTTSQAAASYQPATTAAGTTYFWRVLARNAAGTTTGPVWSFTTAAAPATPTHANADERRHGRGDDSDADVERDRARHRMT